MKKVNSKLSKKYDVLGIKVVSSKSEHVLKVIEENVNLRRKKLDTKPFFVTTVNVEFVMMAQNDQDFKNILNNCDLAVADGFGLRLSQPEIEILPGRKLVADLVGLKRYKIFFLGGKNGVAKEMVNKYGGVGDEGETDIQEQFSNSNFDFLSNDRILKKINQYKPDVLLVAYGAPWQEKWIARNLDKLEAKVVMGVGGTFDFLTGKVKPAPEWMSQTGLEWLWRLIREPWR